MFNNLRITGRSSLFGDLYDKAMESVIEDEFGRGPEYRPSAFPLCPIHILVKLQDGASNGTYFSRMEASGGFFTSVGTAAHENIQTYTGTTGKLWGDWQCRNPRCQKHHDARDLYDEAGNMYRKGTLTRKNTTKNTCPKCKHAMLYVEKEIIYNGLKGHIDAIIELGAGYWVGDYKTTTKSSLRGVRREPDSKVLPEPKHLLQLPTYCYVLEKKYQMKILGFSLLYLSRDNPFEYKEFSYEWDDTWRKRMRNAIKLERVKFKAGIRAFREQDPRIAIDKKPCSCLDQYKKEIDYYNECPLLNVCFTSGLEGYLRKTLNDLPVTKKSMKNTLKRIPAELL
jgi:hypothetical protein